MTRPRLLAALAFGPLILSILACGYYMRQMGVATVGTPISFSPYDETSYIWAWDVVAGQSYEITVASSEGYTSFAYLKICTVATNACSDEQVLASDHQLGEPARVVFTPTEATTLYLVVEASMNTRGRTGLPEPVQYTLLVRPIDE